jgi:hypothetical protein
MSATNAVAAITATPALSSSFSTSSSAAAAAIAAATAAGCPHSAAAVPSTPPSMVAPTPTSALFRAAQSCPVMGKALAVQSMKTVKKTGNHTAASTSSTSNSGFARHISSSPKGHMASPATPSSAGASVVPPPPFIFNNSHHIQHQQQHQQQHKPSHHHHKGMYF